MGIGRLVFISSDSGSAQRFRPEEDGFAIYAASKAALNQSLRHMAAELQRSGRETFVIALHPGEVKTDMANVELGWEVEGQMEVGESVRKCIATIEARGPSDNGTFWTWEGEVRDTCFKERLRRADTFEAISMVVAFRAIYKFFSLIHLLFHLSRGRQQTLE